MTVMTKNSNRDPHTYLVGWTMVVVPMNMMNTTTMTTMVVHAMVLMAVVVKIVMRPLSHWD